jgi:hypothetical protein
MGQEDARLEHVQRWMQAVVVHPGGVVSGIESEAARQYLELSREQVESVIARSQALTSLERLEIYSRAYTARLLECLRSQFPMLAKVLGEELFDEFSFGYLQRHPSQSYTLGRLGEHFVRYLEETRPGDLTGAWPDFLIDLARLEWEFDQVFDGPGVEGQSLLSAEQLQSIPFDRWPAARLVPVPCLRLLSLRYPVHEYYRALRRDEGTTPPLRAETRLAITRQDYVVRYFPLTEKQFPMLEALVRGATIGEALELLACNVTDFDALAAELHAWFRFWTSEGLFLRVDLA